MITASDTLFSKIFDCLSIAPSAPCPKLNSMIFDDVVGPLVIAKKITEERDENAKQLMIALGNKQPASEKEIAELVDKTMSKDPVGIALALEFRIQEKREQVTMRLKLLDATGA